MLSPGWGSPRCGEYGGALLRRGIAVKRRRGQAGMAKGSPSRAIGRWRRPPFQWESMGNSGKPSLRSWWTICVHQTSCGQPSRRLSRPVVWSIWLSSRTIAPIAVSRGRRAGWRAGKAAIWARMSGEALQRIQRSPSSDRAMEDCVRGWAATLPSRTPRQLRQLQFHWGKPPPAAEPRIRMCMGLPRGLEGGPGRPGPNGSAVGEVEGHFETETQVGEAGLGPHGVDPLWWGRAIPAGRVKHQRGSLRMRLSKEFSP